ncbi:tyrosine-type recombinase/integrase [Dysgonomonas sp. GY75]|uniref:tyrosine-type recombinase/integrase n=1 Tax=Dysgonomonas sp. GY75 TaxID=2780419 RepID=UPI0018842032|nr:tyrosine-type recombinase/integrase [Dysgonomonas sp. GY75]
MENKESFQKIFFPLSNNTINRHLKEIIKEADIHKKITLHCLRHSWATTICLSNGVPIETISRFFIPHRFAISFK